MLAVACDRDAAGDRETITVFAAASTQGFVSEIAGLYEERTGTHVRLNLAASSTLARQIESGARADVFLSAHPAWMDRLEERGLVEAGSRRDVLGNSIVLAVPAEDALGIVVMFRMGHDYDFANTWTGRIAIADPEHVPAGMYAKEAMTAMGWWDGVKDRVVPAQDARAAARLVAMGEVQAGVLYASDAATFDGIEAVGVLPGESHAPIRYPAALCAGAGTRAREFLEMLSGPEAREAAATHGFTADGPAE